MRRAMREEPKLTKEVRFALLGRSSAMEDLRKIINEVAPTTVPVFITGESGTGKELVARAIHAQSKNANGRFVALNCSAIPEGLVETELFGHVKGAFTGAIYTKVGKFELAHRGTLFLDEIADMPPTTQAKVLRAVEIGEFERVGGLETIEVTPRIVCATNRDIVEEVKARRFRDDLYSRLEVVLINLPPLRERLEDIPLLAEHFLGMFNAANGRAVALSREAILRIAELAPKLSSNVRSLKTLVERAAVFAETGVILPNNAAFAQTKPITREAPRPEIIGKAVSEESIRNAIRKYGPFRFVLHDAKRSGDRRRIIEQIAMLHNVEITQIRSFFASSGLNVAKIIEDERRSFMIEVLTKNLGPKETAAELGITPKTITHHARKLGIRTRTRSVTMLATI